MKTFNKIAIQNSTLQGTVKVSGAKNSVLRLMAATLLTNEDVSISNYPASLLDAQVHKEMLNELGKTTNVLGDTLIVSEQKKCKTTLDWDGRSIRNTLLILGTLFTRFGYGAVPLPGGCSIGEKGSSRAYDIHITVLEAFGASVSEVNGFLIAEKKYKGRTKACEVKLPMRSTGATENAILISSLAEGTSRIWNPHVRPEILDLISLLNSMGAEIIVHGQEHIEVRGKPYLRGATHEVIPDNVEALTWLVGSSITNGEVEILDFPYEHLEIPLIYLRESGAKIYKHKNSMIVKGSRCFPLELSTGPYPGINSDMQPILAVYAAKAKGQSKFVDLRFPGRYAYAKELNKMGLNSFENGNMLVVNGGDALSAAEVKALDLRAGIALSLAGLIADGTTLIDDAWQIGRGYDSFYEKMRSLGAKIEIIK
ncbi:MAG: UDP-N-acetylglucosamine 1-carboxyvinyltransferase [Rhodospirillaceae bacterium]|nr:UDP-N-acetylglucosamine 1-carboxyvinyltransferase [Rhodospirillaceae bacterium]